MIRRVPRAGYGSIGPKASRQSARSNRREWCAPILRPPTSTACAIWESLADPSAWFPCEFVWPEGAGPLEQHLPEGAWLLTDAPIGSGQWDRLMVELADLVDRFHSAGHRFNGLHLGSIVLDSADRFLGIVMPVCISARDAPVAAVCVGGLNCGFAAPELQGYSTQPAGPATDVFLLAALC